MNAETDPAASPDRAKLGNTSAHSNSSASQAIDGALFESAPVGLLRVDFSATLKLMSTVEYTPPLTRDALSGFLVHQAADLAKIKAANSTVLRLFGTTRASTLLELVTHLPVSLLSWQDMLLGMLKGPGLFQEELQFETESGPLELLVTFEVPQAETDVIICFTDIREYNAQRRQQQVAQRMEAVGRLASGLAHDFNNILTIISSYSDLISAGIPSTDPLQDDVRMLQEAAIRASNLTRQLLAFSPTRGNAAQTLEVNKTLQEMEGLLRSALPERIRWSLHLNASDARVRLEPAQLEQIVMNLVTNARDAVRNSGDEVAVRTSNGLHPGSAYAPDETAVECVLLSVSDNGEGMSELTARKACDPFFTTKQPGRGSGLGLSTVYALVQKAGGTLRIHSRPGLGTTVQVYLPKQPRAEVQPAPPPPALLSTTGSETILVVEDEDAVRTALVRILESAGYRVLQAHDGASALQSIENYPDPIHGVISDLAMPHMGGLEFADRLTTSRPETKVLFMSGHPEGPTGTGTSAPVVYLEKPFPSQALLRRVRRLLDSNELREPTPK